MHICGIQKNGIDDLISKTETETQMLENMCMDTKEERVGGMNWKIDTDVYIYIIDSVYKNDNQ